jgi:hypothetical protein
MSISRRVATVIGTVAIIVGGSMIVVPAAQADWGYTPVGDGRDTCPRYSLCIWTGENFNGVGRRCYENISPGEAVSWLGTVFENQVHSAVNKTTIKITFLNYRGSNNWEEIGALYPGYDFPSGWPGATKADGMAYVNEG